MVTLKHLVLCSFIPRSVYCLQENVACDGERYMKSNLTNYFTRPLTPPNRLKVETRYKIVHTSF
jgi:hypothetical protein